MHYELTCSHVFLSTDGKSSLMYSKAPEMTPISNTLYMIMREPGWELKKRYKEFFPPIARRNIDEEGIDLILKCKNRYFESIYICIAELPLLKPSKYQYHNQRGVLQCQLIGKAAWCKEFSNLYASILWIQFYLLWKHPLPSLFYIQSTDEICIPKIVPRKDSKRPEKQTGPKGSLDDKSIQLHPTYKRETVSVEVQNKWRLLW